MLSAAAQLREHLGVARTAVVDRGGDRRVIPENFLENKQPFIIRQRGDRLPFNGREFLSVSEAAARCGFICRRSTAGCLPKPCGRHV
jgi:hypothetical protein